MPQDLPGFYYAEKNRYFPIKGPIPGSSRNSSSSSLTKKPIIDPVEAIKERKGSGRTTAKLLQIRELYGNVIALKRGKYNFREEYVKSQASEPTIWRYHGTERIADCALDQSHVDLDTPGGAVRTEIVLAGGLNGSFCFSEVGNDIQPFHYGVKSMPDHVWPLDIKKQESSGKPPGHLWRPTGASINMQSAISCIKMFKKQHAMVTTLGSETSGGSVFILNLSEPLEFNTRDSTIWRRMNGIASFNCTVWSADCNFQQSHAIIGTNLGAAVVNLETAASSWICRCKSDVFSLQMDHSKNIALCGLRNGAIVTVDARQRPEGSARLTRQRIPHPSGKSSKSASSSSQKLTKQWFELKGNIYQSDMISMPSSISCLAWLKLYDQYFLASSMDGSIKLYDHRLIQRGAVQSYEGNVNSHTRIQLGVDPSEKFLMSGGEDCKLRLWSIKSGELLFEEKFMNSVPSVVCWQRNEEDNDSRDDYKQNHCGGAWVGSQGGLFHMRSP